MQSITRNILQWGNMRRWNKYANINVCTLAYKKKILSVKRYMAIYSLFQKSI